MKCINKTKLITALLLFSFSTQLVGCGEKEDVVAEVYNYETKFFSSLKVETSLFAEDLIVGESDVELTGYTKGTTEYANDDGSTRSEENYYAGAFFDIENGIQYYGDSIFEQLYPASTTKILTAYLALKYGNLDDVVTVSSVVNEIPSDSSVCGLSEGDVLTLGDLVNGLLIKSGNDSAVVIAEHISGDVESFVELMNQEAYQLGATQSNFVNPHGYHDDDHYTTAYDLYLIFNECIQNETFVEIIQSNSYSTVITNSSGVEETITWYATNRYKTGEVSVPDNLTIIGGKTGYTSLSRSCLILLEVDEDGDQFISIILGAINADTLYSEMTDLIESLPLIR